MRPSRSTLGHLRRCSRSRIALAAPLPNSRRRAEAGRHPSRGARAPPSLGGMGQDQGSAPDGPSQPDIGGGGFEGESVAASCKSVGGQPDRCATWSPCQLMRYIECIKHDLGSR